MSFIQGTSDGRNKLVIQFLTVKLETRHLSSRSIY